MIKINDKQINVTMFPDETSQVWKVEDLYGDVVWSFESEAEIMHLAQLALLMRKSKVPRHLIIQYLPYARQDKEVLNDATFALRAFATVLNGMKWESVEIWDPHSSVALELIHKSKPKYFSHDAVLAMRKTDSGIICFPDAGALTKYTPMFWGIQHVSAEKIRDPATGTIHGIKLNGDVSGERVMIVDDLCDGGATFTGLAKELRAAGAEDVFLFVTHGLFTKGVQVLLDAGISGVFTPNYEVWPQ